ncbi:hypothetical protein [Paenibacillus flagellatus]|uniref:Uncharacterized protein n=1 Tax=Paenibacillus flagellatus TaxID=2211139 RepID=A0A2V5JY32_9BACL|nr:hypothetical protein [Paenibacillus flagellatus]PYI51769.1 hypothetical protein DLM86_22875 [Paenibacillus flagellatus]
MANITYTGVQDVNDVVDYFMANDEHMVNNPIFAESSNVAILKQSLFNLLSRVEHEKDFQDLLNYKNLLFNQLVHYCDSIESIEGLRDDLHELLVHRIYTGSELKILTWIYKESYGHEPDLSNPDGNSPQGFLRYLKMNCKPDVTAHFIGLALQQYVRTQYPDEAFYKDENLFGGCYNYMTELVLETEDLEKLVKTVQEQQEELVWLRDQLIESEQKLQQNPEDEATTQRQQKLIVDFMTERLEMEFLSQVIIRLF